jgi:hypothetical protein
MARAGLPGNRREVPKEEVSPRVRAVLVVTHYEPGSMTWKSLKPAFQCASAMSRRPETLPTLAIRCGLALAMKRVTASNGP